MAILDWQTDVSGYWFSPKLSRDVRVVAQTRQRFRQFVKPEPAMGPHMGDSFKFTKIGNVNAPGQKIGEHDEVPTTDFSLYTDSVTVSEITNSIEWTWYSTLFSELSVEHAIIMSLTNDAAKTLDKESASEFRMADLIYTPTGTVSSKSYALVTNGTVVATATRPMSAWDHMNIIDLLRSTYNCPTYKHGDHYMCVSSTNGLRGLKEDAQITEAMKYGAPDRLFSGEIGMYYGCRFIEENNALTNSYAGGLGEMIYFGDDPVIEIEIYPLEMQAKVAESYGRVKGIRYVWIGGFQKTWTFSSEGQVRMIRVASAA